MPEPAACTGGTACLPAVAFTAVPSPGIYLPAIARDDCTGCQRCALVCPPRCLTMIWDFATLTEPDACTGCARCARACRHGVITMTWQPPPTLPTPA